MHGTLAFGGSDLERAAHLRRGSVAVERVLPLWRGMVPVLGDRLGWLAPDSPALAGAEAPIFLGLDREGPLHARDIPAGATEADPEPGLPPGAAFTELRGLMTRLSPREAELAATARALTHWHRSHRFCAACGHPSDMMDGGWQRTCPACATPHFPRTDPVVIMLVLSGERLLLGRSPGWRPTMHSCLAGFIEPGETIEAAVRREAFEETGIRTGAVRYLASQPWPYPASLMLGCVAEATSTAITIDPEEIESARWADRAEVMEALIGRHPDLSLPQDGSIAYHLITRWLADDLD